MLYVPIVMYSLDPTPHTQAPAPVETRPRQVPWGWRDLLKALVAMVVLVIVAIVVVGVAAAVLRLAGVSGRVLSHDLGLVGLSPHVGVLILSSLITYGAAIAAIVLFIKRPYRASWATLGYRPAPLSRFAILLLAYPATMLATIIVMAVLIRVVLHGHFSNPQTQQIFGGTTRTDANVVALLLLVAVLAPIVEETVFRGVLYQWLRKNLPVWAAAGISAAIFAAVHAIPIIFPWLFVTGIALALVFEYCQTLYCSMLLHGIINGVSVIVAIHTLPT